MLIISHRGAKGLAPENTKASFLEALTSNNVDYIEFDIHTTSDGIVVINHDAKINGHPIAKTKYAALKSSHKELITYNELLEILKDKKPYLIDVKPGSNINIVMRTIESSKTPKGTLIASFNYKILKSAKKYLPKDIELVVLHKWSSVILVSRANRLGTKLIATNHRWLWSGVIKSLIKRGYKLIPYTMNDEQKIIRYKNLGIYAIVTDFPNIIDD